MLTDVGRQCTILIHRRAKETGAARTMEPQTTEKLTTRQSAVSVCGNLTDAKAAIERLKQSGFPPKQISLVARQLEDDSELHG